MLLWITNRKSCVFNVRLDRRSLLWATVRVNGSLDVVFAFQLPS